MLEITDYVIIGLSLALVMAIGLWFARRWKDSDEFFLAGRDVTWPFIGFSLFATNISSEHFVGLASAGHNLGLVEGGYEWIASYCLLVLAAVFAPQYLRHKVFTIPEFFEKRYGVEARMALSGYFLAMIVLTKTAVATYSGSIVIQQFTGWNLTAIMWGIGIFTAAYTMAGGLAAVIYTDFIQALILIAGSAVLTWVALLEVGGWGGLVQKLEAAGRMDMLSMVRPMDDPSGRPFSGFLLGNLCIGGLFYWCMDQVNVQRVLGARSVNHARGGAILAGFLKIIPVFIMVLPGVIAFVLYTDIPKHDATYGILLQRLMPVGLRGFVIAALLAALMSSLSSTFNSASTLVARDFLLRLRPTASLKTQVAVGEVGLVVVLVAGVLCAPLVGSMETIWQYLQEVTGYLSVPFAMAGLLGVLTRRVNRQGVMAGVVVGIAAGLFCFCESKMGWGLLTSPYLASFLHRSFVCAVLTVATMVVTSLLTAPPPQDVLDGAFYLFHRGEAAQERPRSWVADWRIWWWLLFAVVTGLWVVFR